MLFSKKLKILIYITIFVFTLSFMLPICTYAIDKDSVYVWSNTASSVSTSNTPDTESSESSNESQDNRQFFRYNIR